MHHCIYMHSWRFYPCVISHLEHCEKSCQQMFLIFVMVLLTTTCIIQKHSEYRHFLFRQEIMFSLSVHDDYTVDSHTYVIHVTVHIREIKLVWSCPCTTVHLEHPLSLPTPSRKDPKQLVRRGMLTCGLDQKDGFDFYMFNCMRNPCGNSCFWGKTVVWSCPCKTLHLEHPLSLPTPSRKDPKQLVRIGMLTCGLDQKDGFDFYIYVQLHEESMW